MKGISDYAIVYDITADGERRRIEKILKNYGFRIQKSVFECRMDKRTKGELIDRLEGLDITTGFVKIYKQEHSWKDCIIGEPKKKSIDDDNVFVI
ncbi:MAG TPA: CRISPR-associated endonuclease Cas2 [Candidatus Deferrimicrobium sp.]|nr:CRISPR-associated endonuclease Cas2 [Candidatus Kapabacteria bacterium]HLP60625.1 CRISPR-associated endonuclease Cas2 [Candidatus Deferrimicrobium sp.]